MAGSTRHRKGSCVAKRAFYGYEASGAWGILAGPLSLWRQAMQKRAALLILLGLVIGIFATVVSLNALQQRNPFPRAVMSVMAHHAGALKQAVRTQRCDAAQSRQHLLRLQSTAADIPEAFAGAEQPFMDEAGKLRTALQNANQAQPADCAALAAAIKPVGEACQSCHEQYR